MSSVVKYTLALMVLFLLCLGNLVLAQTTPAPIQTPASNVSAQQVTPINSALPAIPGLPAFTVQTNARVNKNIL